MTPDEFKAQLQTAQDMIKGLENQRNAHANECVQLAAQSMGLQRRVQELEAQVTALKAEAQPDPETVPKANGHIEAQLAAH